MMRVMKIKWVLVILVVMGALAKGLPDFALMGARARGSEARSILASLTDLLSQDSLVLKTRAQELGAKLKYYRLTGLDCMGGGWIDFDSSWMEDPTLGPVLSKGVEQCEGSQRGVVFFAVSNEVYFKNSRDVWVLRPSGQVLHLKDGYSSMDYWKRALGLLND